MSLSWKRLGEQYFCHELNQMDLTSGVNKILRPFSNAYRHQRIPASTMSNACVYLFDTCLWFCNMACYYLSTF